MTKRLFVFLLVRWVSKLLVATFWHAPAKVWGTWVVLGAYLLVVAALGVWVGMVRWEHLLIYSLVWCYCARWRWNYAVVRRGVRPLFERRGDI